MKSAIASLAGAMVAAILLVAGPVAAQDYQSLSDQLQRLQRELSDLERYVYSGGSGGSSAAPAGNVVASQEVRLQQLESEISMLNGRIEEIGFRLDQLAEKLDRMNADIDFRLSRLEQGGGTPMASGGGSTTMPTDTAQTNATPDAGATSSTASDAPLPTSSGSSGTLGTMNQADLEAQIANQPSADPDAAAAAAASTGGGSTSTTASVAMPYDLQGDTPEEQYENAFSLLRQAQYADAEAALRTFLDRHPDDLLAGNAQYWLGETYYVRGNYQQAAVTFAEGYKKYPDSGKAPDNLLKLAMSLGELGKGQEACVALGQLRKQFPNAPSNIQDRAARERQRHGCG